MSPTRAMIWKEFRENGKWAALGLLAMAGGLGWVLMEHASRFREYAEYQSIGTPLLSELFQAVVIVGAGLIGLMIALAQTLPEKRLDQWAFLVHRPASRTTLLASKVAAGLMLYVLCVVMPVAVTIVWVAMPNHVPAPFTPGMVGPAVIDLLMGVAYYFAGLVIGLRDARWYGSRVLVAGIAVGASFLAFLVPNFWLALIPAIVAIAVLATAAWGAFVAGGQYARQAWPAKTALGTSIFFGILLLGGVAVAAIANSFPRAWGVYDHRSYALLDDGRFVIFHQVGQKFVEATDLAGNPAPDALKKAHGSHENPNGDVWLTLDERENQPSYRETWYRNAMRYFQFVESPEWEHWYYLQDQAYGVGYSRTTRQAIGTFGPDGFVGRPDANPPAKRFDGRTAPIRRAQWQVHGERESLLTFRSAVYEVDVNRRRIRARFVPPPGEQLVSIAVGQRSEGHGHWDSRQSQYTLEAFVTDKTMSVFAPRGPLLFSIPLEHTLADGFRAVSVSKRGGDKNQPARYFVMYQPKYVGADPSKSPVVVTELTESGAPVARLELPPLEQKPYERGPIRWGEVFTYSVAPPAFMGYRISIAWRYVGSDALRLWLAEPDSRAQFYGALLGGLVSVAASMLIGSWHGLSRRRRIVWAALDFLLGPAGVVTMLCLAAWPGFEKCPGCGKRRSIGSASCPTCSAPFAGPTMDGTGNLRDVNVDVVLRTTAK